MSETANQTPAPLDFSPENMDLAFDPEARKAYMENEQAAIDMNAYNTARPSTPEEAQAAREAHYTESMPEGEDYSELSLPDLAKKLGEAELDNDKTKATDIQDVLEDKLADLSASIQEKSKKQSAQDRVAGQKNLRDRVMSIKDNHKAEITEWANALDATPEDPLVSKDETKGPRTVSLDDVRKAALQERDKAVAEGNEGEIKRLNEFLGGDKSERPDNLEGLTPFQLTTLLEVGMKDIVDAINERDAEKYAKARARVEKIRQVAEENGMIIEEPVQEPTPTEEQPALEVEEAPTKGSILDRMKAGWRRGRLLAMGDRENGLARDEHDAEKSKTGRNLMIGAAAVAATGLAIYAAVKTGEELGSKFAELKRNIIEAKQVANQSGVDKAKAQERAFNYLMKGFKAVEDFSGIKPGEPGFDEAFKQASDLAHQLKEAKS